MKEEKNRRQHMERQRELIREEGSYICPLGRYRGRVVKTVCASPLLTFEKSSMLERLSLPPWDCLLSLFLSSPTPTGVFKIRSYSVAPTGLKLATAGLKIILSRAQPSSAGIMGMHHQCGLEVCFFF